MSFDYQSARKSGYSDEEITAYLTEQNPEFDVKGAVESGYTPEEINLHLSNLEPKSPPDKSNVVEKVINKTGRLATQGTIGAIQAAALPYDVTAIVGRKVAMANAPIELRQSIFSDIDDLLTKKRSGQWTPEDQKEYDELVGLIKDPQKMEKFLPKEEDVPHFDVGSLIESGARQFGVDLSPKGADEMALRWIGYIKNPAKAQELLKNGLNPKNAKEIVKALAPTGKEALRGAGAGTAILLAAENELGPIGTMMAAVIGDVAPGLALKGITQGGKAVTEFAKHPIENTKTLGKQVTAKGIALLTPQDKKAVQEALIKDFRQAGIQADAGTISGNNLLKWFQSTLQQSGLTGGPLEKFKKALSENIVTEYKKIADGLGESIFQSKYEAGEALKNSLKEARDLDKVAYQDLYNSAKQRAGSAQVYVGNVGSQIQDLKKELLEGTLKSPEQQKVINVLDTLQKEVEVEGTSRSARVKALINNKAALNDIIDYEVQGGAKQLLKSVVKEIDKAIESYGETDPTFGKEWKAANAKFAQHAKLFRGQTISQALKTQDPSLIFQKMSTPHGIIEIRKGLDATPEGRQLFKQLSRYKLEEMIGQNMVNSITDQVNLGTFSKLLEKGQNRQIARTLLGEDSLKRLERLQSASGKLAETAQKFLNTSRSGVHAGDLALAGTIVAGLSSILMGNAWPLLSSAGGLTAGRTASKLLADPEFLHLLEEAILESSKGTPASLKSSGMRIATRAKELLGEASEELKLPTKAAIVPASNSKEKT